MDSSPGERTRVIEFVRQPWRALQMPYDERDVKNIELGIKKMAKQQDRQGNQAAGADQGQGAPRGQGASKGEVRRDDRRRDDRRRDDRKGESGRGELMEKVLYINR